MVFQDRRRGAPPDGGGEQARTAGGGRFTGSLTVPEHPTGLVVFAHGSGSSRRSARNRAVAAELNHAGLATFLFDLLTPEEAADRAEVFDIPLLADRLAKATGELAERPETAGLPIGWFGAGTGAAAALWAAVEPDALVRAVVSRGGRPDLAEPRLPAVTAATLLIVGGDDELVLDLNRGAQAWLRCENRLEVLAGAGRLFREPGALAAVAHLAERWFSGHLRPAQDRA
jgi:putative phosphoribosyl transferase